MRRKISYITPRLLIDAYRKATTLSTVNTAPASALAFAANRNLITMTVGLLTTGPTSPTASPSPPHNPPQIRPSLLCHCDENVLR